MPGRAAQLCRWLVCHQERLPGSLSGSRRQDGRMARCTCSAARCPRFAGAARSVNLGLTNSSNQRDWTDQLSRSAGGLPARAPPALPRPTPLSPPSCLRHVDNRPKVLLHPVGQLPGDALQLCLHLQGTASQTCTRVLCMLGDVHRAKMGAAALYTPGERHRNASCWRPWKPSTPPAG